MTLVPLPDLLGAAREGGYAVGYFEAWDGYSLEAVLAAAEAERSPVILGFGCMFVDDDWLDAGGIESLGALGREIADRARVPVAFLLNEARSIGHARRGLSSGYNAVMLTGASTATVSDLVREAHGMGVAVEGELPEDRPSSPLDAAEYVAATGVDCLSVWFGNEHGKEPERLDLDLLATIGDHVDVPLVVHGGSGFPHRAVPAAVAAGVAKFNVGMVLKRAYLSALGTGESSDVHAAVGSRGPDDTQRVAAAATTLIVRELMRVYGSAGHA